MISNSDVTKNCQGVATTWEAEIRERDWKFNFIRDTRHKNSKLQEVHIIFMMSQVSEKSNKHFVRVETNWLDQCDANDLRVEDVHVTLQ